MALNHSPKIVTDGLVFAYDMSNGKSNVGAPTGNLLASPSINGYPTTGNSWGTYNTNQYNSNTYFSIGTISSVSSNIVTTSTAHPLRTYDVVTPQTTGGGVTAGTNYIVKKLSSTTFCLYPYNSSQDGSQGYINPATGNHKVYDDIENDNKISINSTSFPTMWWGPPHLPNSGLVKEIISKGFNGIIGKASTDCVRLHYIRSDNVTDGMAYGVDGVVTAGSAHTVSFWARAASASAVGVTNSYQIYNYGVTTPYNPSWNFTLGALNEWKKYSFTFTPTNPTCISYWFVGAGSLKYDIANIQFESGSVSSNFTPSTRSSAQAIIDLTNNNTITANSLTYASDGTFSFNGSSNSITVPFNSSQFTFNSAQTIIIWMKNQSPSSARRNPYNQAYAGGGTITHENDTSFNYFFGTGGSDNSPYTNITSSFSVVVGETAMICLTRDASTVSWFKNGTFSNSISNPYGASVVTGTNNITIGSGYAGAFGGNIYAVQLYNRALTAAEVKQNFNALRGRFNI